MCFSRRRASFSASVLCSGADSVTGDEVADFHERAGALRRVAAVARQPGTRGDVALLLPREQDRMRIDRVLVLAAGVDLEVHVGRRGLGVAGVAREAEDGAGFDLAAVLGVGGEGGEVGVEEGVAGRGVEPQAVAGDGQRADAVDGAVGDREHGGAEGGEDVVALMDAGVGAGGAEVVGGGRLAVDGERVALAGEALGDLGGALALRLLLLGLGGGGRGGRRRGGGDGDDGVLGQGGRGGDADRGALGQRAVGAAEDQREGGLAAVDGDARGVGEEVGAVLRDVADAAPLEREAGDAAAVGGLAAGGERGAARGGGGHEAVEQVDLAREARGAGGGVAGARGAGHGLGGSDLDAAHLHGHRVVGLRVVTPGLQRPEVAQRTSHDRRLRASPGRRVGARRRGQDGGGEEHGQGDERGAHPAGQCGKRPIPTRLLAERPASIAGMEAATRTLSGDKAQRIVDAMRASVAKRGAAGSTFDHVAREAGVSRGLLHYYFGTKEQLLVEVVRRDSDIRLAALDAAIASAHTGDDLLAALVSSLEDLVERDPSFVALHFELFTSARRTPEIAAELAALHRRIREHVAEQLEAKAREGVISPTADAESVVTVLLSLADGLALRMLADPGHDWGPTLAAAMPAARALLG